MRNGDSPNMSSQAAAVRTKLGSKNILSLEFLLMKKLENQAFIVLPHTDFV